MSYRSKIICCQNPLNLKCKSEKGTLETTGDNAEQIKALNHQEKKRGWNLYFCFAMTTEIFETELLSIQLPLLKGKYNRDFPSDLVVKNSPPNAGKAGSVTAQGTNIPHAVGQLNPQAATKRVAVPQKKTLHAATKTHLATKLPPP